MLTILHGKNVTNSRNLLNSLIKQAQKKNQTITRITTENFQVDNLVNALEPDLFNQERLIILDDFQKFSLSQQKKIAQIINQSSSEKKIIIWANKNLPAKILNLFPKKQDQLFKPDKTIFSFLDSLSPDNKKKSLYLLNQTLKKEAVGLVFYLLVDRIEDLIIAKSDYRKELKKAPWQKKRLIRQAENFSQNQLEKMLKGLILLDYQQKTGQIPYSFEFGLELLIANL
ncbi:MAG: hypothetical protein XD98_0472 [Microgenomates bacterium 39_6]|nr:MAG: hypothetical protein XD98_0472 [Microgenomates bacterium 39_6]